MRDTINDYCRVIIVTIMFGLFFYIVFGGAWLSALGKVSIPSDTKHEVLATLEKRELPDLNISIPVAIKLGESINFRDYLTAKDYEGNDITNDIVIEFSNKNYVDDVFTPVYAGSYLINISVTDSYNYTTKSTYFLEVVDE